MHSLDSIPDLIQLGGPVAVGLMLLSICALTIIAAKIWQFHRIRIGQLKLPQEALELQRQQKSSAALQLAKQSVNPAASALVQAIVGRQSKLADSVIREEVMRYGTDCLESLRGGFRALEIIASLAPLLGLFGTVLGMIDAFHAMEQAGRQVDPAVLSGGIWEALLTTALGIGIAIPVVLMLGWLERRVDRLSHVMGHVVSGVFTIDLLKIAATDRHDEDASQS